MAELVAEQSVSPEHAELCSHLNIVGMVGSIDNDLCGTDMTIGADSALHRIVDACDCLASTAASHMRTFIVEVMGRHCGYLALISSLATPCDWLFIPEAPPEEGWEERIVSTMNAASSGQKTFALILIAEGAEDMNGKTSTRTLYLSLITLTTCANYHCKVPSLCPITDPHHRCPYKGSVCEGYSDQGGAGCQDYSTGTCAEGRPAYCF